MMDSRLAYLLAADAVLLTHVAFVAFVVFGLVLIVAGRVFSWSWVRNPYFRVAHLVAIGIVVLQSWAGVLCPLTHLEMALRTRAGGIAYAGSFIAHWLQKILYYQLPEWAFVVGYTTFGALVVLSWFWVRPRPFAGRSGKDTV